MMSTWCSKRVQTYNKSYFKTRISALSWLITKIILRCTVSKTSEYVEKIRFSLQFDKNKEFFAWRRAHICDNILVTFPLKWEPSLSIFEKNPKHKFDGQYGFSKKSCHLCDNVQNYGTTRQATGDNKKWRKRFACWICNATNTHSEYIIVVAFRI